MLWNGTAWTCSADEGNTYTAGIGLSVSSNQFTLDINGLSAVSSINALDTIAVYTADGTKKITRSNLFSDVLGALNYRGTWDATSNTPSLTTYCTSGNKGHYYVVRTSGTTTLSEISSWATNDWAVCNGTSWEKVQTTNSVLSVFGRTGTIIASGGDYNASQITNTASGDIVAITVQNAINELDTEKISKVLNSGLIFIGNTSNIATGVALSGDATINNLGEITISSDSVSLGDDTTGNYIATIADSGENLFTISNSGSESAAVTIGLVDDGLDFTKFSDTLSLDSSTSITLGNNDLTFALTGNGLAKITRTSSGEWLNMSDGTDSFSIFNTTSTPEGSLTANTGSLAIDTSSGLMYIKTTDTLNTGWSQFGSSVIGLTSLNGLSTQIQTFATDTTGTDFAISSSGSTHTLSLPNASATARGLVTVSAQTFAGVKTFSSNISLSGTTANIALGSNYLSGDGDDEGIYIDSSGNVAIGTSSITSGNIFSLVSGSNVMNYNGHGLLIGSNMLDNPLTTATATSPNELSGSNIPTLLLRRDSSTATTTDVLALETDYVGVGSGAGIRFLGAASSGKYSTARIVGMDSTGTFDGALIFETAAGSSVSNNQLFERMRITASGRVGMGITAPTQDLHVKEKTSGDGIQLVLDTLDERAGLEFKSTTNTARIQFDPDNKMYFDVPASTGGYEFYQSGGTNLFTIAPSGRIGIGTGSPQVKFHLMDTGGTDYATMNSTTDFLIEDTDSNAYITLVAKDNMYSGLQFGSEIDARQGQIIYRADTDKMYFSIGDSTTTVMTLFDGKLGIGTETPTAKLEVNGEILSKARYEINPGRGVNQTLGTHDAYLPNYVMDVTNIHGGDDIDTSAMIPSDILTNYCADEDGCHLRGMVINFEGTTGRLYSYGERFFMYDYNTKRYTITNMDNDSGIDSYPSVREGIDGNTTKTDIWSMAGRCILQDYQTLNDIAFDDISADTIYYRWGQNAFPAEICRLIIED